MEREVAARFGKPHGVMCNSGSSALYLAVELLGLQPGDEVVTCAVTFSTDVAPIVRGGWVPVFVDVEPHTYNVDVDRIEEMIAERTGAILFPNLIGNAPDWDRIAAIADRHGLQVIEDSCDALGATLARHAHRHALDISVTSFANSHIITAAGNGGMVCSTTTSCATGAVCCAAGAGGPSCNSSGRSGANATSGRTRRHRVRQPLHLRRGGVELRAVGAGRGVRARAAGEAAPRTSRGAGATSRATREFFAAARRSVRAPARSSPSLETAWLGYPLMIEPDAGFAARRPPGVPRRARHRHPHDLDRQRHPPADARGRRGACSRVTGCPNADAVMERGVLLPLSHAFDDETLDVVTSRWRTSSHEPISRPPPRGCVT